MTEVEKFWVENPKWTYGKKLVVTASDHDRVVHELSTENTILKARVEKLTKDRDEWEKAARLARQQRGLVRVVK